MDTRERVLQIESFLSGRELLKRDLKSFVTSDLVDILLRVISKLRSVAKCHEAWLTEGRLRPVKVLVILDRYLVNQSLLSVLISIFYRRAV